MHPFDLKPLFDGSEMMLTYKNRPLAGACDYCGDVQVKNMEVEHAMTVQLENVQTNEYPHFDTV